MPVYLPKLKRYSRPSDFVQVKPMIWEIQVEELIMGSWAASKLQLAGDIQCACCGVPIADIGVDKCDDCWHAMGRLNGLAKKSATKAWKQLIEDYRKRIQIGVDRQVQLGKRHTAMSSER